MKLCVASARGVANCSLMSNYEINLENDSMQEFFVKFNGPPESACSVFGVAS